MAEEIVTTRRIVLRGLTLALITGIFYGVVQGLFFDSSPWGAAGLGCVFGLLMGAGEMALGLYRRRRRSPAEIER